MRGRLSLRLLPIVGVVLLAFAAIVGTATIASGKEKLTVKTGTARADKLRGTAGPDRLYGYRGNDVLTGGNGNDVLVGGLGNDRLRGGRGNDRIYARDGQRDTIACGPGKDNVAADLVDRVNRECERKDLKVSTMPKPPAIPVANPTPPTQSPPPPASGSSWQLTVRVTGLGVVKSAPTGIDCPATCRAQMPRGALVKLTAVPSAGQRFEGWGAQCRGTTSLCSISVSTNKWVRASFSGVSGGSPSPSPPPSPPPPSPPSPPPPPPSGNSVVLANETWVCRGPVNLDLVRVTMQSGGDAVHLRENCSGRIGRLEVSTWTADGVKVNAPAPATHDLVIEGGFVRCLGSSGGHQDGIQAMGGLRVTFRNLEINCSSNPNAQLFIASSNGGNPTDIVCEYCLLGGGAAQTLFVANSVRSGARNSVICQGRFSEIRIENAIAPINSGNVIVPSSDARCRP